MPERNAIPVHAADTALADAVDMLAASMTSFTDTWSAHREDEGDSDRLLYEDLALIAEHVRQLHVDAPTTEPSTSELRGLFDVVERLLGAPDYRVRELVCLGFLETLQNIVGEAAAGRSFEPLFGPKTTAAWRAVIAFWEGDRGPLARVISGEG